MTVLIGITQAPEETEQHLFNDFEGVSTTAVVGPFTSSNEASSWMKFMMARTGSYKHVQDPSTPTQGENWYGFTCECTDAEAHCKQPAL